MKRVLLLITLASAIVFASCSKKDNGSDNIEIVDPDYGYIPFYPGNYWVYEQFSIDTLGNETLLNEYDSVVITGTATVNSKSYIVFEGTFLSGPNEVDTILLLRDSSGYYVDPSGNIHMANNNFTDTLSFYTFTNNNTGDTLYQSWYTLEKEPSEISVGAGVFPTINFRGSILTFNPNPGVDDIRYKNRLYSHNVGLVLDTYFFLGSPKRFERRLARYHVDKNSAIH